MFKTSIYKKVEQMRKGGYALFSDKTRKMLLAMGLSLLSVGAFTNVANAQVAVEGDIHKRTDNLEAGKVRYNITLTEDIYKLEAIYDVTGVDTEDALFDVDTYIASNPTKEIEMNEGTIGGKKSKVAIEVDDTLVTKILIKNDNATPVKEEDYIVIDLSTLPAANIDNDGPEYDKTSLIKYVSDEGSYIQARFTDKSPIYRIKGVQYERDENGDLVIDPVTNEPVEDVV